MRQRDIVVVEKDDKLAARRGKAEIPRATHAQAGTAHDTKPHVASGGVIELVTIINNDKLDVSVCLGA